jgi:hypothetical protein
MDFSPPDFFNNLSAMAGVSSSGASPVLTPSPLRESYPYYKYIRTPDELGASPKGDLKSLENDVSALIGYTGVLVSGVSSAQRVSPMGDKYFLDTTSECNSPEGLVQRSVFISNIPEGKLPLISSAMGTNFTAFRGLIPGMMENLGAVDPTSVIKAFTQGTDCQRVTMEERDANNRTSMQSRYVLNDDIKELNPCLFQKKRNPVTGVKCTEGFGNRGEEKQFPGDPVFQLYMAGVGLVGVYLLYRAMSLSQKIT